MEEKGGVVLEEEVKDDMIDRVPAILTKTFITASDHTIFLQHQRQKERIAMILTNPSNGEHINAKSFGSLANPRANNNCLNPNSSEKEKK